MPYSKPCSVCGTEFGPRDNGRGGHRLSRWRTQPTCSTACRNAAIPRGPDSPHWTGTSPKAYRMHKGDTCTRCSFVAEHSCQLDVHHIDGNNRNHDPANLVTLCSNCHRLTMFAEEVYHSFQFSV